MKEPKTAVGNAREHSLHIGGFMLNEQGKLLRDVKGDYVRVPADVMTKTEAEKWE